jgi:hypothetical protein
MAPIAPNLGKKILFSSLAARINRCLEPTYSCTNTAIRAHSVQNAAVMDLLHRNGHVKLLTANRRNADRFELIWSDIGRNLATTFEGFCSEHDTALFAPIDTGPFDPADRERLFLYAYRAIARELHQLMEAAVRTQSMYQQRIEAGIDNGNEPELAGMMAVEHMMTAHSTFVYKSWLDEALLGRDFNILNHEIVRLAPQAPAIAASVFFDLDTRRYQDEPPRIALNILPVSRDETVVIFSFTDADAEPVREYIDEIFRSSGEYQKYLISRLLLLHAENFVVAPALFDNWNDEKRNAIRHFFLETIRYGSAEQCEHFYLF